MTPSHYDVPCRATWAYHRDMGRIHPECPDPDFSHLPAAVLAQLRREPDEDEDEEEDDRKKEEDDDDDDEGDGYSE